MVKVVQDDRLPKIEAFAKIEMYEEVTASCTIEDSSFALGTISGKLLIYQLDNLVSQSDLDSEIISIFPYGDGVIAASNIGLVQCLDKIPMWEINVTSGIDNFVFSGVFGYFSDSNGEVVVIDSEGNQIYSQFHEDVNRLAASEDGDLFAIAKTDGTLIISTPSNELLQNSSADESDIETISQICFRQDGVLLACRDSLGFTLDDGPENRLECWHSVRGLLHMSELPAISSSILPTKTGAIVGCNNGSLLRFTIGEDVEELAILEHPISSIIQWGEDVIVGTWFNSMRISSKGEVIWSHEHEGLVTNILAINSETIAVIGSSPYGEKPASVVLIDPDSEPIFYESETFDYDFNPSKSKEFTGSLTEAEISEAEAPPSVSLETEGLIHDLEEDIELTTDEKIVSETDLLQDLAESAKAINLPPIADAGDDKTISVEDDGTAIILLDGSRSFDPDGSIDHYSWQNSNGKVIGDSPQVRVRLRAGTHSFELTVIDNNGAASKAIVTMRIQ